MSAVLNDRDAILQAAGTRIVNPKNADILLQLSAPAFHVTAGGTADVASITVSATLVGLEGPLSWSVQGATLTEITDRSATVTYANMQGATAIVTASMTSSGENFAKSCVLATMQDGQPGSSAKTVKLTPSEQVFKISKAGANSPASITLTATGQNTDGTPSFTIPVGTATLSAGSSSAQKVLSFANMTTDQVTVEVTLDGQKDRVTIYKVREGQDGQPGMDAIVGLLTNETVTLPAGSNGTVSSYSGAACTMKMYLGVTEDSANWAYSFAPASASNRLSYTTSGGTLTVTGMAAGVDSAYVDITATKAGAAAITKRFTVTKSKAGASVTGARGAGQYYVVGSAWSDVAAQAACPGGPVVNDQVTISNGTVTYTKRWDGAAWNVPGAYMDGDLFVERSINGSKLKVGTVEVTAPDGTPIVTIGGLQPGFEAPGTKNSDLDPKFIATQAAAAADATAKADAAQAAAISAAAAEAQAKADLAKIQAQAYADGVVDAEEARAIADATAKAEAARVAAVNAAAADATAKANLAATKAEWAGVTGAGKPADNATVGAPSGTMVGGTDAGLVASRALNGDAAYNAVNNATTGLASKLSAAGNQILSGPITLTSAGAIVVGTTDTGVVTNTGGIALRKAGKTRVVMGNDGEFGIFDDLGGLILGAGRSLAEQVAVNPNLLPALPSWFNEGSPAYLHTDTVGGYAKDGYHSVYPKGSEVGTGVVMRRTATPMRLDPSTTYTLSFMAIADTPGCYMTADLVPDTLPESGFAVGTTMQRFVFTWTTPNIADVYSCMLRIFGFNLPGQVLIWDVKLERGTVATAWCDSAITAENAKSRVYIPNLQALAAYVGQLEIGPDGWIRQGAPGYKTGTGIWMGVHGGVPKFSIGKEGGGMLDWDGNTLTITQAKQVTPFKATLPSIDRRSQANTSTLVTYTSLSPTMTDGIGPYQFEWSMNAETGTGGEVRMSGSPTSSAVSILGRGSNIVNVVWVSCRVTDLGTMAVSTAGCQIYWQHGSGQIQ